MNNIQKIFLIITIISGVYVIMLGIDTGEFVFQRNQFGELVGIGWKSAFPFLIGLASMLVVYLFKDKK